MEDCLLQQISQDIEGARKQFDGWKAAHCETLSTLQEKAAVDANDNEGMTQPYRAKALTIYRSHLLDAW